MGGNPLIGVLFHWLGGLSSASFYVPYRRIRAWSWEIFWLVGGVFSWLIAPWLFASIQTHDLLGVLARTPQSTLLWCWFWGAMWGFGGLTFGLTMRYLGLSLGMAVALGLTTVIGTMGPPIFRGTLGELAGTPSGQMTFVGIVITLAGILVVAAAGRRKEREMAGAAASQSVSEFNLPKGLAIAVFSGIMSGCFAWGLDAGAPIRAATVAAGTDPLWQGLPVLCVVLLGGFTTNFLWCGWLILKNRSAPQLAGAGTSEKPPLLRNYALAALGGTLWYFQFFFYSMGQTKMGKYDFSSWTLHMASIIIFAAIWGVSLKEWKSASPRAKAVLACGVGLLILSTVIVGYGNYRSAH